MAFTILGIPYRLSRRGGSYVLRKDAQLGLFGDSQEIKPKRKRQVKSESPGQISLFDETPTPSGDLISLESLTPIAIAPSGNKRRRAPKGGGYYKNSTTGNVQWFKPGAFIPKEFDTPAPVATLFDEPEPAQPAPKAPKRQVEAPPTQSMPVTPSPISERGGVSQKELDRIAASAASGAKYQQKMAEHKKRLASQPNPLADLAEQRQKDILASQAEWVEFEGVQVLQVPGSRFIAVPSTGKKNAANFDVIDTSDRTDFVARLTKKEVHGWLTRTYLDREKDEELTDSEPSIAQAEALVDAPRAEGFQFYNNESSSDRSARVNLLAQLPPSKLEDYRSEVEAEIHRVSQRDAGDEWGVDPADSDYFKLLSLERSAVKGALIRQETVGWEEPSNNQEKTEPQSAQPEEFQILEFVPAESSADYQAIKGRKRRQKVNAEVKAILDRGGDFTPEELATLGGYSGRGGIGTDDVSLNEYYTRPDVAKFAVDLLYRHGFQGGVIEEPSCGSGVFLGQCDRAGVKAVGIEFDPTSSAVAKVMNPGAEVVPERFERYCLDNAETSADAIVGNVPFGVRLTTKDFKANNFKPQWSKNEDLFVDASLDRLAPEGMMAIIVPHGVVSGTDHMNLRQELVKKGRVVGAYRLPESAFKHSDTSVVTDILVVQKHPDAVLNAIAAGNQSAISATADHGFVGGGYFDENPEHILGAVGTKKRGDRETLSVKGDINTEIMEAAPVLEPTVNYEGIEKGPKRPLLQVGDERFINGKKYRLNENHRWELVDTLETEQSEQEDAGLDPAVYGVESIAEAEARLQDVGQRVMIPPDHLLSYRQLASGVLSQDEIQAMADAAIALNHASGSADRDKIAHAMLLAHHLKMQQAGEMDEVELERSLNMLQQYRELYGNPSTDKDLKAIALAHPALLSLQGAFDEEGAISDYFANPEAVKAGGDRVYTDHMDAMQEAFRASGGEPVDLQDIGQFLEGVGDREVIVQLLGDPRVGYSNGMFQPAERLYRGNGYELMADLQAQADGLPEGDPYRKKLEEQIGNVAARLQPRSIEDMTIPIWAVGEWVSQDAFNAFMRDRGYHEIFRDDEDDEWEFDRRSGSRDYTTQLEADTLIALNRGRISHGSKTKEAKAEVAGLEAEFKDWLAGSDYRLDVEAAYNAAFTGDITQEYSGDTLEIAGIDQRDGKRLHHYQNSTIRQMAEQGRGIIALNVGLGKTACAIALSQHLKELGRAKKPCMVVPKSVLANWFKEVNFWGKDLKVMILGMTQQFWANGEPAWEVPGHVFKMKGGNPVLDADGNYVLFTKEDAKSKSNPVTMSPDQVAKLGSFAFKEDDAATKEKKMQQVAQNSYDLVLMSEPVFQSIGLDPEREFAEMEEIMGRHINDASADNKKKFYELQKRKEAKIAQLSDRRSEKTENITWENLGIDCLFHDEAHHLKNLFATGSRTGDVAFLSNAESQRSLDFYYKSKYIREQNNNQNVFLLTATPTSNNPLEAYNMLMQVCPEEFDKRGIRNIDDFLGIFGDITSVTVPGVNLELTEKNGLVGFKNLKDLRSLFNKYTRMQDAKDVGLPIPKENGQDVSVDMTPTQREVYEGLRARANELLQGKVEEGEDHIFSVISDMDKAALDPEYYNDTTTSGESIDLSAPGATRSPKIESAVARTMASRQANGGKQIVFCDAVQLHDKIRQQYIDAGYPANEIQIVNAKTVPKSSDRQKVSQAYNDGRVTLVIGNTATMGEGMNFQIGTTDIHHLTTPWTPAAIDQRNGRGVRQGNTLDGVECHYYAANGSFDGYRKGTLERKRGWLNDLWKGDSDTAQNQNTGGMSMDEMTIALSSNPEATRKAIESNREMQMAKLRAEKQSQATKQFGQLQTMKLALSKMSPERRQSGAGRQLQERHDRAVKGLLNNEHFAYRSLLENNEPAYIGGDGTVIAPGHHIEKSDGSVFRVTAVDAAKQTIFTEQVIGPTHAPFKMEDKTEFGFKQVNSPSKYRSDAVKPSAFNPSDRVQRLVEGVSGYQDLSHLETEHVESHRAKVEQRLRDSYSKVAYVQPSGEFGIAYGSKIPEDAKILLPHDTGAVDQIVQAIAGGKVADYQAQTVLEQFTGKKWYGGLREEVGQKVRQIQETRASTETRPQAISRAAEALHQASSIKDYGDRVEARARATQGLSQEEKDAARAEESNLQIAQIEARARQRLEEKRATESAVSAPSPSQPSNSPVSTILSSAKPDLSPSDRAKVEQVSRGLEVSVANQLGELDNWKSKEATKAQVESLILNHLYSDETGLPGSYSEQEISNLASKVTQHYLEASESRAGQKISDAVSTMQRAGIDPEAQKQAVSGLSQEELIEVGTQLVTAERNERAQQLLGSTAPAAPTSAPASAKPANGIRAEIKQTTHAKKGIDLHVVALQDRVSRDKYDDLNSKAKRLGGYYSSYAKQGAIPGFQFSDPDKAAEFLDYTRSLEKSLITFRIGGVGYHLGEGRSGLPTLLRIH